MKVVLRRAAERDVERAALWYEQQRPGLGFDFLNSVRNRIEDISHDPEARPIVVNNLRRALLDRFPYGLFYVIEDERLVVLACFHVRQNPDRWTSRS